MKTLFKLALLSFLLALGTPYLQYVQPYLTGQLVYDNFVAGRTYLVSLITMTNGKALGHILAPNNFVDTWQWAFFGTADYLNDGTNKARYDPVIYIQRVPSSTTDWYIKSKSGGKQSYLGINHRTTAQGTSLAFFGTMNYITTSGNNYTYRFRISSDGKITGVKNDGSLMAFSPVLFGVNCNPWCWGYFDRNKNPPSQQSKMNIGQLVLSQWNAKYQSARTHLSSSH